MIWRGREAQLVGTKCVINISAEPQRSKLTMVSRDPRQWRIKPDAYTGVVEEVGPECEIIQPGDRVVLERWQYKQTDIDDERIFADESQVLVYQKKRPDGTFGEETCMIGVVVMRLISQLPKTQLTLPDDVIQRQKKKTFLHVGRVTNTGSKTVKVGQLAWVERRERHQYLTQDGRLMFINCQDSWGEYPIWMLGEKVEIEKRKPMEVVK